MKATTPKRFSNFTRMIREYVTVFLVLSAAVAFGYTSLILFEQIVSTEFTRTLLGAILGTASFVLLAHVASGFVKHKLGDA